MIFNTISLVLALAPTTIFAAPTPSTFESAIANLLAKRGLNPKVISKLQDGVCDLSGAAMPIAVQPLPAPGSDLTLSHVAVGRGTQNYTCTNLPSTSAPKATGALATLFNTTCTSVQAPAVLADITNLALTYDIPSNQIASIMQSGHHEFNTDGKPFFKLETASVNYGFVQAKSTANSTAPATASKGANGLGSVLWLKLDGTDGDYKAVYRLNTAGGVAPKTCDGITGDFTVPYAAEYWFWK